MQAQLTNFPLSWPLGWSITPFHKRKSSRFKVTMAEARDDVYKQLKHMRAKNILVSSNIHTYVKGGQEIMYTDQRMSHQEPGVAVYFQWKGKDYAIACDTFKSVGENLRAIGKTLKALREIENWGTSQIMESAFAGFSLKELPEAANCWHVLSMQPTKSIDAVIQRWREMCKTHQHNSEQLLRLNLAKEEALKTINR